MVVAATAAASGLIGLYSGGARRLYVGNLHLNVKEDQLRQLCFIHMFTYNRMNVMGLFIAV